MKKISIVIPCYNEEATLAEILNRVISVPLPNWTKEIIVVDDASSDRTPQILDGFKQQIIVVRHPENKGKGSAVETGLTRVTGDYILIQDADLEYSPTEIPALLAAIEHEKSIVYGSRNIHNPERKGFWIPRLGVWTITKLINLLYRTDLTDVWTCYKLFPAHVKAHFGAGRFESEIIFTLEVLRKEYVIKEVPISHKPRDIAHGKKIRYRDGFLALALIVKDRILNLHQISRGMKIFLGYVALCLALMTLMFGTKYPEFIPTSDSPSYIQAIEVLRQDVIKGNVPEGFIPNRILTTYFGLSTVRIFASLSTEGNLLNAWLLMNSIFYFVSCLLMYGILRRFFRSHWVAFFGGAFFAANYAMLLFGLNYYMDIGGWTFYLAAIYCMVKYLDSHKYQHVMWAAVMIGIGVMFKEYGVLGSIPLAGVLAYESYPSVWKFIKRIFWPAVVSVIPLFFLSVWVFDTFGYTYANWLGANQETYIYASRFVEYVKSFGSLLNVFGILCLFGLFYFIQYLRSNWKNTSERPRIALVVSIIISALLVFKWPAITQRVEFIAVPALIMITGYFFKKYEHSMKARYIFIVIFGIYVYVNYRMDYLLQNINLPF